MVETDFCKQSFDLHRHTVAQKPPTSQHKITAKIFTKQLWPLNSWYPLESHGMSQTWGWWMSI